MQQQILIATHRINKKRLSWLQNHLYNLSIKKNLNPSVQKKQHLFTCPVKVTINSRCVIGSRLSAVSEEGPSVPLLMTHLT